MFNSEKHKAAGQSIFMNSVTGLANLLAVVITIIGSPPLYGRTAEWVQSYTAMHYGSGFEGLTAFVWGAICAGLVFFISRASISTALVMGGLALASRMF